MGILLDRIQDRSPNHLCSVELRKQMLKIALDTVGEKGIVAVHEDGTRGAGYVARYGTMIEAFQKEAGVSRGEDYCVAFVYWCYNRAAEALNRKEPVPVYKNPMPYHSKSCRKVYDYAFLMGSVVDYPEPGDLFISSKRKIKHMGIVRKVRGTLAEVDTVEGNTSIYDPEYSSRTRENHRDLWGAFRRSGKDLSNCYFIRF